MNAITRQNSTDDSGRLEKAASGALTLSRGLDVLERVAAGDRSLADIARALGMNKSTTHRLATTLVELNFLNQGPREGYSLGTRLLELGQATFEQIPVVRVARPHLLKLSADTGDAANLGTIDDDRVYFLDKIQGSRRIMIQCTVGERQMLRSTGLGKALLFDADEAALRAVYAREAREQPDYKYDVDSWLRLMAGYRQAGYALDLDENDDQVRCVAAPVRDAANRIVAAISVSSPAQYMDDSRIGTLAVYVCETAAAISADLGQTPSKL